MRVAVVVAAVRTARTQTAATQVAGPGLEPGVVVVTAPVQARPLSAPAAGRRQRCPSSLAVIDRFTAETVTNQSRAAAVDGLGAVAAAVVAVAAIETAAAGISARHCS
jgi:hypothetical protein